MEQEPNVSSEEQSNEQERTEPTTAELVEVCKEVLSSEDCEELAGMDFDEALNNAATMLEAQGVDWVSFLTEKGILESESE